jgi:lipoprotein-anchoring transpeptidase ErfK/SrfK
MKRIALFFAGAGVAAALLPATALADTPAPTATTAVAATTAAASTTTTTTTTTTPKAKPKPKVKQAKGRISIVLKGTFPLGSGPVTTTGRAVRLTGAIRPYIAGQTVLVHGFIGHRRIVNVRSRVFRGSGGLGVFSVRFSAPAGEVAVSVVHDSTPTLSRLAAHTSFGSLVPNAGFGSSGRIVQLVQSRLAALHFYIPRSGSYDTYTGLAVDAYHRLLGWGFGQTAGPATVAALLNGTGSFHIRYPQDGRHAEGNLGKQLLALAVGSNVVAIYPISSGKPSTPTVLGRYHVYQKTPGYLPDGMYFSNFFTGGYAIHGFDPAPDYPASHGCMRVPIPDAISIYNWIGVGDGVDVYY